MKIIITGGSGLVGKAIKKIVEEEKEEKEKEEKRDKDEYYFLSSKDCDLLNYEETYKYFAGIQPDYVIHLAAFVGGLFKNMNQKVDMLEQNLIMNYNVVKICHKLKVKKTICCLSTCIFPDKTTYPINETMLHDGPPHDSNNAYAYAKRMLEVHCNAYNEQYGDNFVCIIPTNIYGPHDNFSLEDAHVIPALIHKCYLAKQSGEKFVVRGTGKPLRQFIYSTDLAKLILMIMRHYHEKTPIILSVDEKDETSIANVAKLIAKEYDYEDMLEFDDSYSDGQYKKTADNSKLKKVFENLNLKERKESKGVETKGVEETEAFKFTPINEGIRETVKWFKANYDVSRK